MNKYIEKIIGHIGRNNEETRNKWLKQTLSKIPADSRILDAGAGELKYKPFCSHLQYVSQDFAKYDGEGDNKGLQTSVWDQTKLDIVSDITNIPNPDKSFDAIMCVEVFEHLPDPISAIKEFSRLCKPDGNLIITAPFCSLTHFLPFHYYSGFNRYFYEKHLTENGFEIIEIETNGNFFEFIAQETRRLPLICSKYADKKINIIDKAIMLLFLNLVYRYGKKSSKSEELLCFGYQILAKKITN